MVTFFGSWLIMILKYKIFIRYLSLTVLFINFSHLYFVNLYRNTMEAVPANSLGEVRSLALNACVIGIDEGQFVSVYINCVFSS